MVYLGKVNAIELYQKTRKNYNDVFLFVKIGITDFTNKKLEDIGWYLTELKKTHSFLQDLGEIKYPLDVIGTIKNEVVKSIARNNIQYKNNPTDYVYYCKWLSMEMFPTPATVPSELTSTINEFVLTK